MKKIIFAIFVLSASVFAQQKLLIIGGGDRPIDALDVFVKSVGGAKARVLIITWASGDQPASFKSISEDFDKMQKASIEAAPFAPIDAEKRPKLIEQINAANAIFFTGGDQNRIMDVLKDAELLKLLRDRYNAGVAFGGTSAGAAIMSTPMMTGEADLTKIFDAKIETREGLGLLPNAIVDQHFVKRQRENRLFGLLVKNPQMLGVGIDEDAAIFVENNRKVTVYGPTHVMFINAAKGKNRFEIFMLAKGEKYDLKKRKPASK